MAIEKIHIVDLPPFGSILESFQLEAPGEVVRGGGDVDDSSCSVEPLFCCSGQDGKQELGEIVGAWGSISGEGMAGMQQDKIPRRLVWIVIS